MANYIVKDDNPDVGFELILGEVRDTEGNVITDPQGLTKEISSTDESVLGFTPGEPGRGTVNFGSPGQASLEYSVKDAQGNVLGSGSDGFTVTTGDPHSIASITGTFDGLTPEPPPPAAATGDATTGTSETPAAGTTDTPGTGGATDSTPTSGGAFEG